MKVEELNEIIKKSGVLPKLMEKMDVIDQLMYMAAIEQYAESIKHIVEKYVDGKRTYSFNFKPKGDKK